MTTVIWSKPPTVFWTCGNNFSQMTNVHGVNVMKTEIPAAESLVPQPSAFEVEMATEKLKTQINPKVLVKSQQK
jgi:hypothetical protein